MDRSRRHEYTEVIEWSGERTKERGSRSKRYFTVIQLLDNVIGCRRYECLHGFT